MSSTWTGSHLRLSIFGQSHGAAIGMTLDGLPAGERIDVPQLQQFLDRRAPGQNAWSTPRKETDAPEFLSGLLEDRTCGAPLAAIIRNSNTKSQDYALLRDVPRPGHADLTAQLKYGGFQDGSGGGHFSGRLTAPLCIAGGICLQLLRRRGIFLGAHIASIANAWDTPFDPVSVSEADFHRVASQEFPVLDGQAGIRMQEAIAQALKEQDSVGGVIECAIVGLPAGLGEPMFDGMENRLAQMLFSIPAVKGVDFGAGFSAAALRGSAHNDAFYWEGNCVKTRTNRHGGILGGITSGMPLTFRAAIKPTPSIAKEQESIRFSTHESEPLSVKGRHDPCIVPRAVPCVEAAAALVLLDALLEQEGIRPIQEGVNP